MEKRGIDALEHSELEGLELSPGRLPRGGGM